MGRSKGTILIIDDDLALQHMLSLGLKEAGYKVVGAGDGQEGLYQLTQCQPSLVLCDVMMPNIDGIELFMLVKENLQDEGIPIIVMTALNRKPWFAELEAEGAVIVQKPFQIDSLIELISSYLN